MTRRSIGIIAVYTLFFFLAGCQEKLGGGISSTAAGGKSKTFVYGIRSGQQLAFVIFADTSGLASAGSSWTGTIKPKEGTVLEYKGEVDGIEISGSKYDFENGRVFLATTKGEKISIEQLGIPIGEGPYEEELESIQKDEKVRAFLSK